MAANICFKKKNLAINLNAKNIKISIGQKNWIAQKLRCVVQNYIAQNFVWRNSPTLRQNTSQT